MESLKQFIKRFGKALTFTCIGLFFILHWTLVQRDATFGDYVAISAIVILSWVLDYFNSK